MSEYKASILYIIRGRGIADVNACFVLKFAFQREEGRKRREWGILSPHPEGWWVFCLPKAG